VVHFSIFKEKIFLYPQVTAEVSFSTAAHRYLAYVSKCGTFVWVIWKNVKYLPLKHLWVI